MDEKESQLLTRLLQRDKHAAREFYETYSPKLFRFIRAKVNNEKDVEELVQDTLFAFLEGVRDFRADSRLSTYLFSIAHHKVIDFYRKRELKRIVFSQLPPSLELLVSGLVDPQKIFDEKLLGQKIKWIFKSLAPHYTQVLYLKYVEGRNVAEIAQKMALSFKAVESILFRARKAFVRLYTIGEL